MATLQFFPLIIDSSEPYAFSARNDPFQQPDANALPRQTLEFRSTEIICSGETSVYRGVLTGLKAQELKAICKLAVDPRRSSMHRFENEACVYQTTLRDMQGRYIPEFYGVYDGTIGCDSAVCIITEDCGKSIRTFSDLSDEWLIKTIEILMAVHKRGLQHNDFYPHNVVVDDVKNPSFIKLIDFQHCTPHKCERQMKMSAYDLPPVYPEFGCRELWSAAKRSRVWTPSLMSTCSGGVHILSFDSAADLVKLVPEYETSTGSFEEALQMAKADIRAWYNKWQHRTGYIDGEAILELEPAM